jgi:hypothetical protein
MNKVVIPPSLPALVKPTLDTPFHIDYGWWERVGLQISLELRAHLCQEHQAVFKEHFDVDEIDWVDEKTGEVTQVDGLQHVLRVHCSKQLDYISQNVSLVDAIFRVFLANGNMPLTCKELGSITGRSPEKILRTLAGRRVYKGLRPVQKD